MTTPGPTGPPGATGAGTATASPPGQFDPNAAGAGADTSQPQDVSSLWGSGISSTDISLPVYLTDVPGAPTGGGTGMTANSGADNPNNQVPGLKTTVGQALRDIYSYGDSDYQQLQQQLYASGFWTSTKPPRLGDKTDQATYDAWKNAVITAARSGMSVQDVIDSSINGGSPGLGSGPAGATRVYPGGKVTVPLTNPDDVRYVGDQTAQRLLGRNLTDAEAKAITDVVQGQESTAGSQKASADESQKEASIQANEALYGSQGQAVTAGGTGGTGTPDPATIQAITQVAQQLGIPAQVAIAIAEQESGLNPTNVGDNGTSFGLYQLHQGGELGNLTQSQAFDPATNATTALTVVATVARQHPNWSWGQIAAAAQRPADQAGYAASVNKLLAGQNVPVQGVTPGGSKGTGTDVFLQPTVSNINTPVAPDAATQAYLYRNDSTELQNAQLIQQFSNFSQVLHSMPGDTGAARAGKA